MQWENIASLIKNQFSNRILSLEGWGKVRKKLTDVRFPIGKVDYNSKDLPNYFQSANSLAIQFDWNKNKQEGNFHR